MIYRRAHYSSGSAFSRTHSISPSMILKDDSHHNCCRLFQLHLHKMSRCSTQGLSPGRLFLTFIIYCLFMMSLFLAFNPQITVCVSIIVSHFAFIYNFSLLIVCNHCWCHMATMWSSYVLNVPSWDLHVGIMWSSCGHHVIFMWWRLGYFVTFMCDHVGTMRPSYDLQVIFMWKLCDLHVDIMWSACSHHVDIMWSSCGNHVTSFNPFYFPQMYSMHLHSQVFVICNCI